MKRAIILIAFLIMLMLLPCVEAHNDSMKVLVFVPQDQYKAGDEVTVSVHIFDKAEYVDPTSINGKMITINMEDDYSTSERPIELYQNQLGIWTGTINLTDEDVNSDGIIFETAAQEQKNEDEGSTFIFFDDYFGYYDISIRAQNPEKLIAPQSGDTINFIISIKSSDEYVDPEEINVKMVQSDTMYELYLTEEEGHDSELMPISWVSTGNYTTFYEIPDLKESRYFSIIVETEKGESFSIMPFDSEFSVDFCQIWFHELKSTSTSSSFEIYVSDLTGRIIEGAVVDLEYSYIQYDDSYWMEEEYTEPEEQIENAGQKTTDDEGKVRYDITFPDDVDSVEGFGEVRFNGYTQHFYGPIYLGDFYYEEEYYEEEEEYSEPFLPPEEEEPYGYGFEVIPEEADEEYQFGDYVERHYTAYYTEDTSPIGIDRPQDPELYVNGMIYYYIFSEEEILIYGETETDGQGKFELAFYLSLIEDGDENPYEYYSYEICFEAPTHEADITEQDSTNDGMIYDEAWDYIGVSNIEMYIEDDSYLDDLFNNDIEVNVEHLYVGGISGLEMVSDNYGENYRAYSSWMPFAFSEEMVDSPPEDLMKWYPWTNDGMVSNLLKLNGSKYEGTICVPEFMPINIDYTIMVQMYNLDTINSMDYYSTPMVSYITVTPEAAPGSLAERRGDSPTGNAGGFSLDWWILVIFILIIIVIIGVVVVHKRRRKKIRAAELTHQPQPHPQISKKFECPQCKSQFFINGYQGQTVPIKCPSCNVQGQIRI